MKKPRVANVAANAEFLMAFKELAKPLLAMLPIPVQTAKALVRTIEIPDGYYLLFLRLMRHLM